MPCIRGVLGMYHFMVRPEPTSDGVARAPGVLLPWRRRLVRELYYVSKWLHFSGTRPIGYLVRPASARALSPQKPYDM